MACPLQGSTRIIITVAGKRVVLATGNQGKIREVAELLSPLNLTIIAQAELNIAPAAETGSTFADNAMLKARHAASCCGLPAIADDSGLSVLALGGRPGVMSARFAGESASDEQNISRLLEELEGVTGEQRAAAFHCAAVFVDTDQGTPPVIAEGVWSGMILHEPDGTGGFGYDPVFYDPVAKKSAANMTAAEKNAVSHRGRAFRQLASLLRKETCQS